MMSRDEWEKRYENQPVRALQHMLRRLSLEYEFLPSLVESGVFGEKTLEAVMLFQRELYPPVTGIVDRGTWETIYRLWQEVERRQAIPRPLRVFPGEGLRVEQGMQWETLYLPQTMFRLLAAYLHEFEEGEANGAHDSSFTENIRRLQRAGGLPETGVLDGHSWELLSRLYEVLVVRERENVPLSDNSWG